MRTKLNFFSEEKPNYISPKNNKYSVDELASYIKKGGAFVDYKLSEGNLRGGDFHDPFPEEDINSLLEHEKIHEAYQSFVDQNGGKLVPAVQKINDETVQLLKNLASSGRELVQEGWQYIEDSQITEKISVPLKELNAFLEGNPIQKRALDEVGNSLGYRYARGVDFSKDISVVYEQGGCSSGFIPIVSKVTALVESVEAYLKFEQNAAPQNQM